MLLVTKGFVQNYSIDDIHAAALAEFDQDLQAVDRLNQAYTEAQAHYLFTLMCLRVEKADQQ